MKEIMNNKAMYVAPMIEVMNARVEKGFAGSGDLNIDSSLEKVTNNEVHNYSGADFD